MRTVVEARVVKAFGKEAALIPIDWFAIYASALIKEQWGSTSAHRIELARYQAEAEAKADAVAQKPGRKQRKRK